MIAEELRLVVKAEVDKAVTDMNRFSGSTQKTTSTLAKFALGIGTTVASVYTLRKAFTLAREAAEIGAQANQIRVALDSMAKQAGTSARWITMEMQKMSGNTIDQLRIMSSASKAALLGIPLEQLGDLMQVARASATALGTDVGQMFDDLATGIGRQSKMILDNLGINVSAEKAYKEYAATLGKTSAQLTDNERRQAFLNAVLADGKRIMDQVGEAGQAMTATEPWQIMTAAITDAKIVLGEQLFPLFNKGALIVAEMVRDMTSYLSNLPATFEAVGNLIKIILQETFSWDMIKANVVDMAMAFFETWKKTVVLIPRLWWETVKTIGRIFENFGEWIISIFSNVWTQVRNLAVDKIGNLLEKIGIDIERKAIPAVMKLSDVFNESADDAGQGYAEMGKILWDTLSTNLNTYGKMLENLAANYKDNPAFQEALNQLKAIKEQAEAAATAAGKAVPGTPEGPPAAVPEREDTAQLVAWELAAYEDYYDKLRHAQQTINAWREDEERKVTEKNKEEIQKRIDEIERWRDAVGQVYQDAFESMGEALASGENAWVAFGDVMKEVVAMGLEALGKRAFVEAAAAFAEGFVNPKMFAAAAAWGTAAAMAFVAAGAVRALAEGGVVTRPTVALVGERGPEAVIPLNRAGGMGTNITVIQNIHGSVLTERQLQRFAMRGMMEYVRGY